MRPFTFEGLAVAAVTPFTASGALDLHLFADLIAWWIDEGVEGLVICGSTGEMAYLNPDERLRLFEVGVATGRGRVPVIAGTGFPDTRATVETTRAAAELGVDAALVVTPYYYPLRGEELVAHYAAVAQGADLPLLAYNMPPFTHLNLSAALVQRLSGIEGVVGMKDSAGDLAQLKAIRARTPEDFCLLTGSFPLLVDALEAGANGAILAMANLIPSACTRLRKLALVDPAAARALHREFDGLQAWLKGHGIPGLKHRLAEQGHPAGRPRGPLLPLSSA